MGGVGDADRIEDERLQIEDLRAASARRHQLVRGTRDYAAAMEIEEQLAARIWRRVRAAARAPIREPMPAGQAESGDRPAETEDRRRTRRIAGSN